MNTRKTAYIEPGEDTLQKEVDWALTRIIHENHE